jgi:hypothetical protein
MPATPSTRLIRILWIATLSAGLFWLGDPLYRAGDYSSVVEAQTRRAAGDGPRLGSCPVFPADNVWNTPVDKLRKDPRNDNYIDSIGARAKVHPDFGVSSGIPYGEVPPGTRGVRVAFDYRDESDLGNYPIPPNPPIEGGGKAGGDAHLLLIDLRRCMLYELFATHVGADGSWNAGAGVKMDLTSNALRTSGMTSADAAGLPIFPGLVRYDEVASGEIKHALRFTVPHTQSTFIWPARHKASKDPDQNLPPMGARFRLRADFDISKYSKTNQVIMTALKKYGMFVADNGGAMYITGVPDRRWDDEDLHKLNGMTAEDFEVVDEGLWQMLPDSARVDPLATDR